MGVYIITMKINDYMHEYTVFYKRITIMQAANLALARGQIPVEFWSGQ